MTAFDWGDGWGESDDAPAQAPGRRWSDADDFVRNHLRHVYVRQVGPHSSNLHWSRRWWDVPEAVHRLTALWRAWEALSADEETGLAVWFRDFCDPTMRELLAPDGPFQGLPRELLEANAPGEPWACEPAPAGRLERVLAASANGREVPR